MDRDRDQFSSFIEQSQIKASDIPPFEHWLGSHGLRDIKEPKERQGDLRAEESNTYASEQELLGQKPLESMQDRVNVLASHMAAQQKEHEEALLNTGRMFDQLLWEIENMCMCFQESLSAQGMPTHQIYSRIDADRSVGTLNVLWHTVSFTARGNTKPMAMYRFGQDPIFTGRIVALRGDYQEISGQSLMPEFSELLPHEVASMYVPSDANTPVVLNVKHLGDEEQYLNQGDAARQFLLKVVEMVCAGGYFHEKEYYS